MHGLLGCGGFSSPNMGGLEAEEASTQGSPHHQHASAERLSVRTGAAVGGGTPPSPSLHATTGIPDLDWASGPFRAAPVGYLMRATPTSTPMASPREGTPPAGSDLEAPLLPGRRKHGAGGHAAAFEDCGWIRPICFGLINTAAGVVSVCV